jgi:PAS domain S-box-containing protein
VTSTLASSGGPPSSDDDLFRSIFDNSLEAILITDPSTGGIVEANAEACRLFGGTLASMRAREREEFADPTDPRTVTALARRAETGRFAGVVTMRRRDGSRFEADLLATLFTDAAGRPRSCVFVRDITQREQAAKSLMASEHRYRSLVETTGSVLLGITQDGMIFEWNREAQHVFGYSRREMLGRNYLELFVPHAGREPWRAEVRSAMAGEPVRSLESTVVARDGGEHRLLWNIARLLDASSEAVGVLASGQDITERIRAEETLRNVKALVESAGDLIAYADVDGRLVYANASARRTLGIDEPEAMSIFDLLAPRAREMADRDLLPALRETGTWSGEAPLRGAREGEELDAEITAFLVRDAKGAEARYIAFVARDVAERKRLLAERQEFEARVRHAQKLESLGVLAGGIAHDFNNLLVGILGNASLALMELDESSPLHEVMRDIETTARRAADLTRQMLAYSGRGKFVVRRVNLSSLVEEMAHLLQTVISKGAVLRFDFATDVPPVDADETQIRQIVMNLITNASDAIGSRSGFITLRTGALHADRAYLRSAYIDDELPEGQYAYVEVIDTGAGMSEDTMSRMFDPFFSTKFTGRGLGLSATLGIVRGHRGTVRVTSAPGEGTTFRVLLPCSAAASTPEAASVAVAAPPGGRTVLVVDDDETVRSVTRAMLERRGYSVLLAADGREGVERFARDHERIALVLLDLTMPHLSGDDAFRAMLEVRPDARVVLMSGFSGHELSERFGAEGLAGFIQKPFRMDDLDALLARVLPPREARRD